MATLDELKSAVDDLLGIAAADRVLQLNSDTCERAYEVYALALCAQAVRNSGGTATLTGIVTGANPAVLVFRGAPGAMSSRAQDFCYLSCVLGRKRFEIHVDVVYEGQSGANHE